jgi:hypothetical protein
MAAEISREDRSRVASLLEGYADELRESARWADSAEERDALRQTEEEARQAASFLRSLPDGSGEPEKGPEALVEVELEEACCGLPGFRRGPWCSSGR